MSLIDKAREEASTKMEKNSTLQIYGAILIGIALYLLLLKVIMAKSGVYYRPNREET